MNELNISYQCQICHINVFHIIKYCVIRQKSSDDVRNLWGVSLRESQIVRLINVSALSARVSEKNRQ